MTFIFFQPILSIVGVVALYKNKEGFLQNHRFSIIRLSIDIVDSNCIIGLRNEIF